MVVVFAGMLCVLSRGYKSPGGSKGAQSDPRCPLGLLPGHTTADTGRRLLNFVTLCSAFRGAMFILHLARAARTGGDALGTAWRSWP